MQRMRFDTLLAVAVLLVACCAVPSLRTSELRARTALDVLADVVDPAYQLAMQGCIDALDVTMRAGETDAATPAATEAGIDAITARCDRVRAGFDKIRGYHEAAISAVEDSDFDGATTLIDKLRAEWGDLQTVPGKDAGP